MEWNPQVFQVKDTFPGIELVHFCADDRAKKEWRDTTPQHTLGEVMFWYYIAPIIYNIQDAIGCQYAFLFAADSSSNGSLVNYYDVALKFQKPESVGTNKPYYDFTCEFMCQEISHLRKHRQEFFDNYNPDPTDDII